MKRKLWIYKTLIISMLFLAAREVSGQKNGEALFGMGFPEMANIGVKYRIYKQIRTGFSTGLLPRATFKRGAWDNLISFSGDIYYHFGRTPHFSDLKLFYVKIGLNCIMQKPFRRSENWWNSCFRVGGEVFTSKHFGVIIEGGIIYNLNPETNWARMDRFLPALGTGILYRF